MKKIIKNFFKELVLLNVLLNFVRFGHMPSYRHCGGKIAVLANGPSLKDALANRDSDDAFMDTDFATLNFFAFGDTFKILRPKYYCSADPMFFGENHRIDDVRRLFDILQNEVDWEMSIYVPARAYKRFIAFSGITNKNIRVVKANTTPYQGSAYMRNRLYKKGLAMPIVQTVANLAIYVAINMGYDEINLFGVDHTFFDSLCVDENNRLCSQVGHYYETEVQLLPILNSEGKIYKIADYLYDISRMFRSHDLLADYAHNVGANIVNCTTCSMIDSYPKRKN